MTATVGTARARRATIIFGLALGLVVWALPATASAQTGLEPINLAQSKFARQSSTLYGGYYGGDASVAVDGNLDGEFWNGSVTHTDYEAHPWWEVDLGEVRQLGRIEIANRTDCCAERLLNFMVIVGDIPLIDADMTDADTVIFPGIMRTIVPNQGQSRVVVPINRSGRFVRIALVNENYLSLAEVQVIEADNAARGRSASQTTTEPGGEAWRAVDGNTSGIFAAGSVAVTRKQTNPIPTAPVWKVDLGMQHDIREIHVWSSNTDCCGIVTPRPQLKVYVSTTEIIVPLSSMLVATVSQGAPAKVLVNKPGRYVAVDILSSGPLSLAEVQVWAMARGSVGAHVISSHRDPTFGNSVQEAASIDLNSATTFENFHAGDQPYWDADLGARRYLETVKLWPKPGDASLATFHLFASDTDFVNGSGVRLTQVQDVVAKPGVSHWIGRGIEPVTAISVMRPARFLRVQLDGYNEIRFGEAEIVTTEGIAMATRMGFSQQRNNASAETLGSNINATGTVEQVVAGSKNLKITGYFPRPNTVINADHVVPFMGSFGAFRFASAVTGTTPVLTSYSAAPMYPFTVENARMPMGWLQGSVTNLVFSADDNYGYTPTPIRGINDNGTEQVYWPDNRLVSASPTPDDTLFLDTPGEGIFAVTQPSAQTYLDLPAGQQTIVGYPNNTLIPTTLSAFKNKYGITATSSIRASYYNAGDLGLGRDMYCRRPTGFTVCVVDNIAAVDSNHQPIFGAPAAAGGPNAKLVASVVMVQPDYDINAGGYSPPWFGAYDANGNRLNSIALDKTGKRTAIPNNCLTCHGGSGLGADAQGRPIVKKAYFLPFDLTAFLDRGSFKLADQQEQFRQLNAFVKSSGPPVVMRDLIDGWYQGAVNTVGKTFDGKFIPSAWKKTPGTARVYDEAIGPYCRTCHNAQDNSSGGVDFARPADVENLRALILANVCSIRRMPHAQQTLTRFWKSGARAQLLGYYGRNEFFATCGR